MKFAAIALVFATYLDEYGAIRVGNNTTFDNETTEDYGMEDYREIKLESIPYFTEHKEHLNNWHVATLGTFDGQTFTWTNRAGVAWSLYASQHDPENGRITEFNVGQDCPYFGSGYTKAPVTYRKKKNTWILESVKGPGEEFRYVVDWTLADKQMYTEDPWIKGLQFEAIDYVGTEHANDWHYITVSNPSGDGKHFEWRNRAGVSWSLAPSYKWYPRTESDSDLRVKGFSVSANCPYYSDGHTWAQVKYTKLGVTKGIDGPWKERYGHVLGFTH